MKLGTEWELFPYSFHDLSFDFVPGFRDFLELQGIRREAFFETASNVRFDLWVKYLRTLESELGWSYSLNTNTKFFFRNFVL